MAKSTDELLKESRELNTKAIKITDQAKETVRRSRAILAALVDTDSRRKWNKKSPGRRA